MWDMPYDVANYVYNMTYRYFVYFRHAPHNPPVFTVHYSIDDQRERLDVISTLADVLGVSYIEVDKSYRAGTRQRVTP